MSTIPSSPTKPIVIAAPISAASASPLDEAWELLKNSDKVIDETKLMLYLSEIGITKSSELIDCDEEMIEIITSYLKPLPKKIFVRKVNEAKCK